MNRYLLVDLKNYCISSLAKVDTDFEDNETQTSSISCKDKWDLIHELEKIIKEEEDIFIDKQYEKMKKWIFSTENYNLTEHYSWYEVEEGDKEDLLNTMFESYCDTYDNEELEERINDLLEED